MNDEDKNTKLDKNEHDCFHDLKKKIAKTFKNYKTCTIFNQSKACVICQH